MNKIQSYRANMIACWFLAFAEVEHYEIEHIKLQKLLYFAQAHHLAKFERPLFEEDLEAWKHGPVVRSVYNTIDKEIFEVVQLEEDFNFDDIDADTTDFLISIWNTYARLNSKHLSNKTHKELPWKWYYDAGSSYSHEIIPKNVLKNYYLLGDITIPTGSLVGNV